MGSKTSKLTCLLLPLGVRGQPDADVRSLRQQVAAFQLDRRALLARTATSDPFIALVQARVGA